MKEVTLTVLFEGTIYSINTPNTHLHNILYNDCNGVHIKTPDDLQKNPAASHLKMGFDGCGIANGVTGALFGAGLSRQATEVVMIIRDLIKSGNKVKLNAIGLSRGALAAFIVIQQLKLIDPAHLEINLLALDPVPGNLLTTASWDFFHFTWAKQLVDLSDSRNLKYAEALYPYVEVGDDTNDGIDKALASFHVPIRPTYPKGCVVKEEVILGAHLKAFHDEAKDAEKTVQLYGVDLVPVIRKLSKNLIYSFLIKVGSLTLNNQDNTQQELIAGFEREKEKWSQALAAIIKDIIPKTRPLHSQDNSCITVTNKARFLNKTHRDIVDRTQTDPNNLCLKIEPERPNAMVGQPLTKISLIQLIDAILPLINKSSRKAALLIKIKGYLENAQDVQLEQYSFILRDIIATTIQRTAGSWWLFYESYETGLVNIINTPSFKSIKDHIKLSDANINYSNLSTFVLGREDNSHFDEHDADKNFEALEKHSLGEDLFPALL